MRFYLSGKQAQAIDKYTQEIVGTPGLELMESAAGKLAEVIDDAISNATEYALNNKCYKKLVGFDKRKDKLLSVVESGNNGGDAVAAAWMLKDMGYDTYIYEINGISRKTDSYLAEIEKAKEHGVTFVEAGELDIDDIHSGLHNYKVIIDGIFGVGLTRDIVGVQAEAVNEINSLVMQADDRENVAAPFIVGVDIPSGISADTGHMLGVAVKCDMTVTFEYTKYGMLINEGRTYSGDIRCESIGLYVPDSLTDMASLFQKEQLGMLSNPDDVSATRRDTESLYINFEYDASEIMKMIPKRRADSNKGTYGKVLIIAGSRDIYGAVYMAAEAAYRVGTGLVKVVTDIRNRDVLCDKLPEAMLLTYDTDELLKVAGKNKKKILDNSFIKNYQDSIGWADIILAGPGLGTLSVSEMLLKVLAVSLDENKKLILDADALNVISNRNSKKWFKEFTKRVGDGNVIITPHMMEMSRIVKAGYNKATYDFMLKGLGYDSDIAFIKNYGKHQAYSLAYNEGVITVLKDARTIVAFKNSCDDAPEMEGYMRECPVYINTTGNSGMSKGGSGDVLAGMIAGLLAQCRGGEIDTADIVCAAVHLHGKAGDVAKDRIGERSMLARDIIDSIPEVFAEKLG